MVTILGMVTILQYYLGWSYICEYSQHTKSQRRRGLKKFGHNKTYQRNAHMKPHVGAALHHKNKPAKIFLCTEGVNMHTHVLLCTQAFMPHVCVFVHRSLQNFVWLSATILWVLNFIKIYTFIVVVFAKGYLHLLNP